MNKYLLILIGVLALILVIEPAFAQCPMCRASAETALRDGDTTAKGLNSGILYLFVTPFAIVGSVGYFWWKSNKQA